MTMFVQRRRMESKTSSVRPAKRDPILEAAKEAAGIAHATAALDSSADATAAADDAIFSAASNRFGGSFGMFCGLSAVPTTDAV